MFGALVLCVSSFAFAARLLLDRDCSSLEVPTDLRNRNSGIDDALLYYCLRLGLWAPVSVFVFWGLFGLALLVFVWREHQEETG